MEIVLLLLLCLSFNLGFTAKNELVATTHCFCPGLEFNYFNCTVIGGLFTVWKGSAFNDGCEITLPHINFNTGTATGSCNNRAITAQGIRGENDCYTSQLTIRPSISLQGVTVECAVNDNSGEMTIGHIVLNFTQNPPPAPENIYVTVSNFSELTFKWIPLNISCPVLNYSTTTNNCGTCATDYGSAVTTCTGYSKRVRVNECNFTVQSVICGNITGASSISDKIVNLQVPQAPEVSFVPHYLDGRLPFLLKIVTTFSVVKSFEITNGISGAANFYTVNYFDALSNKSCKVANASCNSTMCTHTYFTSSSTCPSSTNIMLTVVATNIIGEGPPSMSKQIAGENNFVDIRFDTTSRGITMSCIYRNQSINIIKYCNVSIAYGTDCDKTLGTYRNMNVSSTVITPPIDSVPGVNEYCYSVSASYGNERIAIEGNLNIISNSDAGRNTNTHEITAGTVVPLIVIVIAIIIVTIIIIRINRKTPLITLKFSNKKGASSLVRILKKFQERKVNIICMNTNWDISKIRDKYLFRFCCTTEKKDKLGIDEVLELPNQEGHFVAELSVENKPGALLTTLEKFICCEIENVGVNTNPNRGSIKNPDYEDHSVSFRCTEKKLKSLLKDLETSDAKYVKQVYTEPAKKNLHFWIMSEDVAEEALLVALKAFSDLAICITGVNSSEDCGAKYYVQCSCSKQESIDDLLKKLKHPAIGATNVDIHPQSGNDTGPRVLSESCAIIEFTIRNEAGSLDAALSVFIKLGIKVHHISTSKRKDDSRTISKQVDYQIITFTVKLDGARGSEHINQLMNNLKARGCVIDRSQFQNKQTSSNEQSVQFGIRYMKMGALVPAIQAFNDLNIFIVGIDLGIKPETFPVIYKKNSVEFLATTDEKHELTSKLKATGFVLFKEDFT